MPFSLVHFSDTVALLYQPVYGCPLPDGSIPNGYPTCEAYVSTTADYMKSRSFEVAGFWVLLLIACIFGNLVTVWGFGTASERLNKRLRDSSFAALLRQEVAFFDKRSVAALTSQLQDDAARIHAFTGEPVRTFIVAVSSTITGVVVSLVVSQFTFFFLVAAQAAHSIPFSTCGLLLYSLLVAFHFHSLYMPLD